MKTKPTDIANQNVFTPDQIAAIDSMRAALTTEVEELDEAASYAANFARSFFLWRNVQSAAAFAMKDLIHQRLGRSTRLPIDWPSRN